MALNIHVPRPCYNFYVKLFVVNSKKFCNSPVINRRVCKVIYGFFLRWCLMNSTPRTHNSEFCRSIKWNQRGKWYVKQDKFCICKCKTEWLLIKVPNSVKIWFCIIISKVQIYDQIVFESIKSPGHFFHASSPFQIDHCTFG